MTSFRGSPGNTTSSFCWVDSIPGQAGRISPGDTQSSVYLGKSGRNSFARCMHSRNQDDKAELWGRHSRSQNGGIKGQSPAWTTWEKDSLVRGNDAAQVHEGLGQRLVSLKESLPSPSPRWIRSKLIKGLPAAVAQLQAPCWQSTAESRHYAGLPEPWAATSQFWILALRVGTCAPQAGPGLTPQQNRAKPPGPGCDTKHLRTVLCFYSNKS